MQVARAPVPCSLEVRLSVHVSPSSARPVRAAAVCLALGALLASACSSSPAPLSDAERLAKGKEILQKATSRIAAASTVTFDVAQDITRDSAGAARKTLKVTNVVHLRRPDRLHLSATGDLGRDFWYDGTKATIALHAEKVFGEAPMPATMDEAIDVITDRYDVPIPLSELMYADGSALPALATGGGYVDTVDLSGVKADHLSFTTGETRWDLWVSQGTEPTILQAHVAYGARKTRPTHHMVFSNWTFGSTLADDMFVARFGNDYEGIAMLQRADAVTEARDATAVETASPATPPPAAPAATPTAAKPAGQ